MHIWGWHIFLPFRGVCLNKGTNTSDAQASLGTGTNRAYTFGQKLDTIYRAGMLRLNDMEQEFGQLHLLNV